MTATAAAAYADAYAYAAAVKALRKRTIERAVAAFEEAIALTEVSP